MAPWGVEADPADALIRDTTHTMRAVLSDTGRATTSVVTEADGARSDPNVTLFEFAGADERFWVPAGYDNRIVDGQNYFQGFSDPHPEQWYHVLCNTGLERSTPSPRNLAETLSTDADFEVVGDEVIDGAPTTHLRATNPSAIPADVIAGEAEGTAETTAFDIWGRRRRRHSPPRRRHRNHDPRPRRPHRARRVDDRLHRPRRRHHHHRPHRTQVEDCEGL